MQPGSLPSKNALPEADAAGITVKVKFLVHFRQLFGAKEKEIHLPRGCSMGQLLHSLGDTPERRGALLDGVRVSAHAVVLKNGVPVREAEDLAVELFHGDTVAIFPFLAGG